MLNTNKITKENLQTLGNLLRNNKGIKTLNILNEGSNSFETKKEFCNEIINLLESGKLLQVVCITRSGYFGETRINLNNYKNDSEIESIQIGVYKLTENKSNPSEWTLD